jgi:hypothetical protein
MRGLVCRLQFLLALASAVIVGSESSGTHDHTLLPQIGDSGFERGFWQHLHSSRFKQSDEGEAVIG